VERKPIIEVFEQKCTNCKICQLWCSFTNFGEFNPENAYIKIKEGYSLHPKISFTDECIECYQCVTYCLYKALTIAKGDE
jgi:Pyruvate/2-oxoacid:ferredoxin oxidoreductase delta subunit